MRKFPIPSENFENKGKGKAVLNTFETVLDILQHRKMFKDVFLPSPYLVREMLREVFNRLNKP